MIPIYNLSDENKQALKSMYFIEDENKEVEEKDLGAIIEFRQKLYELARNSAKHAAYKTEGDFELMSQAKELKTFIENYVGKFDENSLMKRAMFIYNLNTFISSDLDNAIKSQLSYELMENTDDKLYEIKSKLIDFLQYTCLKSLFESPKFEECNKRLAQNMAGELKKQINQNYLSYINENDLTYYDLYYLIGEVNKKRDSNKTEFDEFSASHCDVCGRDDCMSTPSCEFIDEKESLYSKYSMYDDLASFLTKTLNDEPVSLINVEDCLNRFKDVKIKRVAKSLLVDKNYSREQKVINLEFSKDKIIKINPLNVMYELYHDLSCGHGLILSNNDDIATFILLNNVDWSQTRGKILDDLKEYYERNKEALSREFGGEDSPSSEF